jgi:hypothetical protein
VGNESGRCMTQFSLVANAIRPQLWKRFCDSLMNNKSTFEVIFVGPHEPICQLPSFFKFIKSDVKPSQRMEIAVRNATGEIISLTSDDANYNHADFANNPVLDTIWSSYERHGMDSKLMFQPDTFEEYNDGIQRMGSKHRFIFGNALTPLMCTNGFITREFYSSSGGYDKNFIAGQGNNDVILRLYCLGGRVLFDSRAQIYFHHAEAHGIETSQGRGWDERDRAYLESLWMKNGKLLNKRLKEFEPFSDEDIQTINQGVTP